MLHHFEDCSELPPPRGRTLFPRTISTGATDGRQYTISSREDAASFCRAALYEDFRINCYSNYDSMIEKGYLPIGYKPVPRHVMIDMDRDSFGSDEDLEQALKETIDNIRRDVYLSSGPTVIRSGNGYHIHVPLKVETAFENMPDFEMFGDGSSVKFMRWSEQRWTNGKADQSHNPSFKSCMARMPGTINSKARALGKEDPVVRVVKPWYRQDAFSRGRPRQEFLNDFHAYLVQEIINERAENSVRRQKLALGLFKDINSISWIGKLLQTPIEDRRKDVIFWVLAPYLITVRGLGYDQAYSIIESWLDKCAQVRGLEPSKADFRYRIRYCLDVAESKERWPIGLEKFKRYYPDAYNKCLKLDHSGGV